MPNDPQVNHHFSGRLEDCPDCDFAAVIQRVDAVLLNMSPMASPLALTRVWCLFEISTAILRDTRLHLFALDDDRASEGAAVASSVPCCWNQQRGIRGDTTAELGHNTAASADEDGGNDTGEVTVNLDQLPSINVGFADATVSSDRDMILGLVAQAFGSLESCNAQIYALLRSSVLDRQLARTLSALRLRGPCRAEVWVLEAIL